MTIICLFITHCPAAGEIQMSENTVTDRRVIRTRNAIRGALVGLIEEKGFDALSVKGGLEESGLLTRLLTLGMKKA